MQKHNLCNYQVEIDKNATTKWYEEYDGWGCECGHCHNFLRLAKMKKLPLHIIQILDELDISPEKATYVCELYTDDMGIHYQFSYRIAGTIIDTPITNGENWNEGRCCHEPYPYGAPDFPKPHFDLEFYATLPWILEETQN
ncbi:MAG: hypothetical protein IKK09_01430 [Clostridia bacterium]|nr:hypothetical protein [Clostridia bacterium]